MERALMKFLRICNNRFIYVVRWYIYLFYFSFFSIIPPQLRENGVGDIYFSKQFRNTIGLRHNNRRKMCVYRVFSMCLDCIFKLILYAFVLCWVAFPTARWRNVIGLLIDWLFFPIRSFIIGYFSDLSIRFSRTWKNTSVTTTSSIQVFLILCFF